MRLTDLKPCAYCNGPLRKGMVAQWYVVTSTIALINPRAANETLGMTQFFQGSYALGEIFSPHADDAVIIAGEKDPALLTKIHICMDCMYGHPLGHMLEAINERSKSKENMAEDAGTMVADPVPER